VPAEPIVLGATGIGKRFGGVTALSAVDIALRPGEVHAIVGENGAGKSTLVKILSGVLRPDRGAVEVDGEPVTFGSPRDAAARGVAIVSQELSLFGDLTVAENLFPLRGPRRAGLLSAGRAEALSRPALTELGLPVAMHARVGDLALADQQLLEIGRALVQNPRVLILDEPTSALPREAADRLKAVLRRLVKRGIAVLYISHFLEEVLLVADRVTVLRDGQTVVDGVVAGSVRLDDLVTAMLGETVVAQPIQRPDSLPDGRPTVVFDRVTVPDRLREVSFTVGAEQIVGVAGLQGAGHLAVLELLAGRTRPASGSVRIGGAPGPHSLRAAVRAGIAVVSSDRKRYGLMLDKPVWQNMSSVSWLGLGRGGAWLRRRALLADATRHAARLRIRCAPKDLVGNLSGGNQQKVVFAKWLDAKPDVVVLDDPTRGVDVGARAEMHRVIADLATDGRTVLIASTDLVELAELCDRVLVFQRGRLVDDMPRNRLSEQNLSLAMNAGFAVTQK
jgi:ABC-type sugar transport system ATPase subunit